MDATKRKKGLSDCYIQTPIWLSRMNTMSGDEKLLWSYLNFRKGKNESCNPAQKTIMEHLGIGSNNTLNKRLKVLIQKGLLEILSIGKGREKRSQYIIKTPDKTCIRVQVIETDKTCNSDKIKPAILADKTCNSDKIKPAPVCTKIINNIKINNKKQQQKENAVDVKIDNLGEEEEKRILDWWKKSIPGATISPGDKSMLAGLTLLQVQGFHAKLPWIQNLGCLLKKSTEAADREECLRKQSFWESHTRKIKMAVRLAEMNASQRDAFFARYRDLREAFERKMAKPDFRIFFETMESLFQREAEEYRQKSANRTTAAEAAAPDTPRLRLTKPAVKFEYREPTKEQIARTREKVQQMRKTLQTMAG